MNGIIKFFDKLEDVLRIHLTRHPVIYSCIGAVGIVLVWKGVWDIADHYPILWGPVSLVIGVVVLLATGLMVSFFIGDSIMLSGFKHEKKLSEKTEEEVRAEEGGIAKIERELATIEHTLEELKEERDKK